MKINNLPSCTKEFPSHLIDKFISVTVIFKVLAQQKTICSYLSPTCAIDTKNDIAPGAENTQWKSEVLNHLVSSYIFSHCIAHLSKLTHNIQHVKIHTPTRYAICFLNLTSFIFPQPLKNCATSFLVKSRDRLPTYTVDTPVSEKFQKWKFYGQAKMRY